MRFWCRFLALFLLISPLSWAVDEFDALQEFDDDDFLSANTEPDSEGLIGWSLFRTDSGEDRYIINFNNVSVIEYLRFVSKISNVNFQFEEAELDFTITVVSEEPLAVQNILSALIQTLRARGFRLLEEDNNLLITKSKDISQIPKIITPKMAKEGEETAPIVTRIFRVENANLNSLSSILRPMMSKSAMIEVSNETRQLIVTDIITNVDKIAELLKSLDAPHMPLEIDLYKARHIGVERLIEMTEKIIKPFAEENPLIFVPQPDSNSIFIVSTPNLIERAVEIFEDLDRKPDKVSKIPSTGDQVFLYKIESKSGSDLLDALEEIADQLEDSGSPSFQLISALENAKYIKESNSLMFITDSETKTKLQAILQTLDTFTDTRNFYVYKLANAGKEQVEKSLDQLARSLKKGDAEQDLIDTIHSMRYIKETNSLIFTGTDESLKKLKDILPTFDTAITEASPTDHFWLYTPQYLSGKELEDAMEDLKDSLSASGLQDTIFLKAIDSMEWVPSTNTLLFTGSPRSLEHIQSMIKLIDVPSGSPSKIFIYKPKYLDDEQIEDALDELADKLGRKNLSERNLAKAIDDLSWISESQVFLFKSDPSTIEKLQQFLQEIDTPQEAESIASAYYLYKLKFARGDDVIDQLEKIAKNLPKKDPTQKAIIDVIDDASYLRDTNSILITGTQKAVDDVKELIQQFDVQGAVPPDYKKTSFYIYKPKYLTPHTLEEALKETANDLKRSGLVDPTLLQSIDTMRVVEMTGSLIFTGTPESLDKTKEIIASTDIKGAKGEELGEFAGRSFYIYKVRYVPISELMRLIQNVVSNLTKEGPDTHSALIKALKTAKEIKETNSILFTGTPEVLEKIADLMKQLDSPEGLGVPEEAREAGDYVLYKPVNVSGPELIDMMCDFVRTLKQSGVRDPQLCHTINHLQFIPKTGYILISGDTQSVEKVQELLRKFDTPGTVGVTSLAQLDTSFLVYKLRYHQGTDIQDALKKIGADLSQTDPGAGSKLLKAINSIQWIKITNSLLATGSPDILTQLKELLENIDIPLRQVFIETLIIQTTIDNSQQFGLQWGGKAQYLSRFAAGTSNFPAASPLPDAADASRALATPLQKVSNTTPPVATDITLPSTGNGGFDLGVIGDIILHKGKSFVSLASLVNALQSDADSVVVMNPKIIAQDNQQSTIFVGQNIPFTGSNVTTNSGGNAQQISTNIEYRDVGTNLSITPILGASDMITLQISNEITEQVPTTSSQSENVQGLQTSRTSLNARVSVPDRHFVALSGMLQDTKTHFKSGIPCLGGLPVIGAIFSENDRLNSRNNVIFFIRPVILDTIEEIDEMTDNQEALYKDLGSKQIVKEEIDEGIDWVRDPYCN